MDAKERIRNILMSREDYVNKTENYLDDADKQKYKAQIEGHRRYIDEKRKQIESLYPNNEKDLGELIKILSEILNKY